MLNNEDLIETYISNAKSRINNLPKPNGNLNKLDKLMKNAEQITVVQKIADEEMDKLLKYINKELAPNWTENQKEEFTTEAIKQFKELLINGAKETLLKS